MRPSVIDDRAFTGLEAAMVFIAFIVVASVFSYVALMPFLYGSEDGGDCVLSGGARRFCRPDC